MLDKKALLPLIVGCSAMLVAGLFTIAASTGGLAAAGNDRLSADESLLAALPYDGPVPEGGTARARILHIRPTGEVRTLYIGTDRSFESLVIDPKGSILYREPPASRTGYQQQVVEGALRRERWLETLNQANLSIISVCPSGFSPADDALAFFGARALSGDGGLMVVSADGAAVRRIAVLQEMRQIRYPSWSPNGLQLAFYFGRDSNDLDYGAPNLGVGVTDLNGNARVLIEQRKVNGKLGGNLYSTPLWSPDSRTLYVSMGPGPGTEEPSFWYKPTVYTYRVDMGSGKIDQLCPGEACAIAPDGAYILVRYAPSDELVGTDGPFRRPPQTWKVDLKSLGRIVLPQRITNPKLSPSGRYAVDAQFSPRRKHTLHFYDTADWTLLRSVEIPDAFIGPDRWASSYAWVKQP